MLQRFCLCACCLVFHLRPGHRWGGNKVPVEVYLHRVWLALEEAGLYSQRRCLEYRSLRSLSAFRETYCGTQPGAQCSFTQAPSQKMLLETECRVQGFDECPVLSGYGLIIALQLGMRWEWGKAARIPHGRRIATSHIGWF